MKKLELSMLSIIAGDDKRALENYVGPRLFIQRKNYDEYTISNKPIYLEDLEAVIEGLEEGFQ